MDGLEIGKSETAEAKEEEGKVKTAKTGRRSRSRKRWGELSPVQKVRNILVGAVEVGLTGLALWDLAHRPEGEINGKKRTWVRASLITPVGPQL